MAADKKSDRLPPTDTEKASISYAESIDDAKKPATDTLAAHEVPIVEFTAAEERAVVRKLDLVIVTFGMCIYLSAYLDRGNLGNARLMGLQEEALGGSDKAFSIALACFFITYTTWGIPGTMAAKWMLPSRSLATGCALWSIGATLMAACSSPGPIYFLRLMIGVGEAMFGQALPLLCTFWYTKREMAVRMGVFISAGSLAGAFGGLIAWGVNSMHNAKISQWRVLFLIEGLPGLILAVALWFFMPTYPEDKQWFLTPRESDICLARKAKESGNEGNRGIDKRAVKRAFTDWKVYAMPVVYFTFNVNASSVSGFLPTIVKNLGYSSAIAQLMTVPPYAVALVTTVIVAHVSDHLQSRGFFLAGSYILGAVGWILLRVLDAASKDKAILSGRYFGCILLVSAAYIVIPLHLSWAASNNPSQTQRAVAMGMLNLIGQQGSILGSFSFPSAHAPHYYRGVYINLGMQCFGALASVLLSLWFRWENRRRDEVEGKPDPDARLNVLEDFDKAVGFRYVP
ncbi:hypothetical protein Q8F55_004757 [Vanrija albida]|uniref:Major facilitator superfamily (MFS) profile domain-containing protein n=1 Tax=Vanrija albida TaxID=181172 RepID=A0ABR3Q003_9TREE